MRRLGAPKESMLATQSNIATTYQNIGRFEEANCVLRDVYSRVGMIGSTFFGLVKLRWKKSESE